MTTEAEQLVGSLKNKIQSSNFVFTAIGNTFPHKEQLRLAGFHWVKQFKHWRTNPGSGLKPTDEVIQKIYHLPGVQLTFEVIMVSRVACSPAAVDTLEGQQPARLTEGKL